MILMHAFGFFVLISALSFATGDAEKSQKDEFEIGDLMHFIPWTNKQPTFTCPAVYGRYPIRQTARCSTSADTPTPPHEVQQGKLYDCKESSATMPGGSTATGTTRTKTITGTRTKIEKKRITRIRRRL
ncbi:hypothetical protein CEXT_96511 [Caerostris extrusa]|uniref:Secreted protein n=1 Tax=Caerostris extrusa TaxID=172846 RepID=A0AAV4UUY7_CAEEX|nr:hypothetical protein CEXT_96511 [Caerostris extrusa]